MLLLSSYDTKRPDIEVVDSVDAVDVAVSDRDLVEAEEPAEANDCSELQRELRSNPFGETDIILI